MLGDRQSVPGSTLDPSPARIGSLTGRTGSGASVAPIAIRGTSGAVSTLILGAWRERRASMGSEGCCLVMSHLDETDANLSSGWMRVQADGLVG